MSATATVTLTPTGGAIPSTLAPIIKGETGPAGAASTVPGPAGPGVPTGGATGQVLAKASNTDHDTAWVAQTGGSGGGATNLAYTASPTGGTVTSDTGTDATLPLADATNAGLMAPAQHSKLAGIAAGATAVAVDATPTNGSSNAVSSDGVFDALANKSDTGHNHAGAYDPAGTASAAIAAHAGTGGTAHADAIAAGAAGFMTGSDKSKLDGIAAGAQVNPTNTDALTEGGTNLYHTAARVRAALLTGLSTAAGTVVAATHTVLEAIGFLQKQVSDNTTAIAGKAATGAIGSSGLTQSTGKMLGRSTAGTGAVEEITVGSGLTLSAGTLTAAGGAIAPLVITDANTVEQYNGTTAQAHRIYNTRTDSTNYERMSMRWNTNAIEIGPENSGPGFPRAMKIISPSAAGTVTLWTNTKFHPISQTPGVGWDFPNGRFLSVELSLKGTNDIFFQAYPADSSGYGILEAYSSAGMVVGTGGNANPVFIQVNRVEVARFTSSLLVLGGGITSSYPALKRSSAELQVRLADDSGYADIRSKNLIATGNLAIGIAAKTADYTVTNNDGALTFDATGAARTATLPALSGTTSGQIHIFSKIDSSANAMNVDANASETINGSTSALSTTTQWGVIRVMVNADKSGWITW